MVNVKVKIITIAVVVGLIIRVYVSSKLNYTNAYRSMSSHTMKI